MTYKELKEIAAKRRAAKQASDDVMSRTVAIANKLKMNLQAKEAAEPRPTTACQRAFRRHMAAVKNASDPRTPLQRVRDLLDAKVASDPALRAMRIIGEARARKEALEVKQQQARKVTLETAVDNKPVFGKQPMEGQENKDGKRSVTFSDGRTIDFPAAHSTPVKSASERAKELLAEKRRNG